VSDFAAFLAARLDEDHAEAYPVRCGCLDANHVPSCVPKPWLDRPRRELAAKREILALADEADEIEAALHDETAHRPKPGEVSIGDRIRAALAAVYEEAS
jgi:hypothetical protein